MEQKWEEQKGIEVEQIIRNILMPFVISKYYYYTMLHNVNYDENICDNRHSIDHKKA